MKEKYNSTIEKRLILLIEELSKDNINILSIKMAEVLTELMIKRGKNEITDKLVAEDYVRRLKYGSF